MKIRCVIIDDEFLARQLLKDYVSKIPFLELRGDFNSPLKALDLLKSNALDLLFLDIQMPDISGLDFLKSLDNQPYIILTTAYKEYALDGYELNVADYLLKPFPFERFLKAVNKVAELVEQKQPVHDHSESEAELTGPQLHDNYLVIRADRKYYKINYDDLIYIEGQKAYVTFVTKRQQITALASLKQLEEQLPANQFVRIHKSYIVSIDKINALEGNSIEIARKFLPIGKNYRSLVDKIFGLKG
ncbi:response regulator transcription factor [candidate division KSB1 bacterium]|nr:response regulator transcription factor [candidate division KSB1 bacterium]